MASCSADKTIKVWDTSSGTELSTLNGHADEVISIALLPNGWLASGSGDTDNQGVGLWKRGRK